MAEDTAWDDENGGRPFTVRNMVHGTPPHRFEPRMQSWGVKMTAVRCGSTENSEIPVKIGGFGAPVVPRPVADPFTVHNMVHGTPPRRFEPRMESRGVEMTAVPCGSMHFRCGSMHFGGFEACKAPKTAVDLIQVFQLTSGAPLRLTGAAQTLKPRSTIDLNVVPRNLGWFQMAEFVFAPPLRSTGGLNSNPVRATILRVVPTQNQCSSMQFTGS